MAGSYMAAKLGKRPPKKGKAKTAKAKTKKAPK